MNNDLERIITYDDILFMKDLVDYQAWLDITLGWSIRCRYQGRDIAWVNGGTMDQLMNRFSRLEFMCYVDVARGLDPR